MQWRLKPPERLLTQGCLQGCLYCSFLRPIMNIRLNTYLGLYYNRIKNLRTVQYTHRDVYDYRTPLFCSTSLCCCGKYIHGRILLRSGKQGTWACKSSHPTPTPSVNQIATLKHLGVSWVNSLTLHTCGSGFLSWDLLSMA